MRTFLSLIFLCWGAAAIAQATEPTFSGSFRNTPLKEAITEIEHSTGYRFFFDPGWLDSLSVTARFDHAPLSEALTAVLAGTGIHHYTLGRQVVLTHQIAIVDSPEITKAFTGKASQIEEIEKGLFFSREYLNDDRSDVESFVFEIGSRNKMVVGGKSTIAGYVRESESQDPVAGALVYIQDPFTATSTDESGFFSLTLPNGKHKIMVQFVGMKTTQRNVALFSDGKLNIDMDVDVIALQEIVVQSDRDVNVKSVQMGVSKIDVESAKNVPIVLGESDVMKIATTLAGVQTVGEGSAGFNVRGGKADQNLILINDAPVYNASHFFGFFSVFNSDAIRNMELYKSGIPAKYGGRLSSVFEIQAKEADKERFSGKGGISPITSRLTLEIPIIKGKTGLMLGGRSTYSNWVLKNVRNAGFKDNRVSFFDLIGQLDHKLDEKNNLTVSAYLSRDKFRLSSDTLFSFSDFSFANANTSVKWRHQFSDHFDGALTGIYASYKYELLYDQSGPNAFRQDFSLNETTLKGDLNYYIGEQHKIRFGGSIKRYFINPGHKMPEGSESIVSEEKVPDERGLETALYLSDQLEITPDLSLYGGLRYTMFNALGPRDVYNYREGSPKNKDTQTGSVHYSRGQVIKTYHGPELRLSGRYTLNGQSSVKLSYNRTRQYIHALSNAASFSPTDTWRLSGAHILPQVADQFSAGFYRNLFGSILETSVEAYYKKIHNLIDFKVGSTFLLNDHIERDVLQGEGKSYGIELSVKKSGKLNGWINYAYARAFIRLDGDAQEERINGGKFYPTSYDKPHTINMVANYKLTRRLSFSLNTTYNTGRPVTFPVAVYDFRGSQNIHFSERNAYRIPDYFRIDLGINLEGNHKIKKLAHSFWSLSIYNLTGRDNPYSVFFDVKEGKIEGHQLVVFSSPIPTLTYNFKF